MCIAYIDPCWRLERTQTNLIWTEFFPPALWSSARSPIEIANDEKLMEMSVWIEYRTECRLVAVCCEPYSICIKARVTNDIIKWNVPIWSRPYGPEGYLRWLHHHKQYKLGPKWGSLSLIGSNIAFVQRNARVLWTTRCRKSPVHQIDSQWTGAFCGRMK